MRKYIENNGKDDGFTLVELLVVLAIIALFAALVAPKVINYIVYAKVQTANTQLRNIKSALELYYLDVGNYPTQEGGLSALAVRPTSVDSWNGPYLAHAEALKDPWGRAYIYIAPVDGNEPKVRSLGRDGKEGGTGTDADLQQ